MTPSRILLDAAPARSQDGIATPATAGRRAAQIATGTCAKHGSLRIRAGACPCA